jgi:hypothetical protein
MKKAGLASGLHGDEVYYALTGGAQKGDATNLESLSEPHRKQNLYANPKRTAKSQILPNFRRCLQKKGSNYFQKTFLALIAFFFIAY